MLVRGAPGAASALPAAERLRTRGGVAHAAVGRQRLGGGGGAEGGGGLEGWRWGGMWGVLFFFEGTPF